MGLLQKTKKTYLKLADGQLYLSTDKEKTKPFPGMEGVLTGLFLKTEKYKNEPVEKVIIELTDDSGEVFALAMNFDSSYTTSFLNFLSSADLNEPVQILPKLEKKEDGKERRTMFVKQNDTYLKSAFKGTDTVPEMVKTVKKSGKVEWDKEDFLQFYRELILKLYQKSQGKSSGKSVTTKKTESLPHIHEETDTSSEEDDDLPF